MNFNPIKFKSESWLEISVLKRALYYDTHNEFPENEYLCLRVGVDIKYGTLVVELQQSVDPEFTHTYELKELIDEGWKLKLQEEKPFAEPQCD